MSCSDQHFRLVQAEGLVVFQESNFSDVIKVAPSVSVVIAITVVVVGIDLHSW